MCSREQTIAKTCARFMFICTPAMTPVFRIIYVKFQGLVPAMRQQWPSHPHVNSLLMEFIPLPIHLILLVHLHILEYPHANNSEYDHDLFNSRTRGLRERATAMEDITYFLVGKIEGKTAKIVRNMKRVASRERKKVFYRGQF